MFQKKADIFLYFAEKLQKQGENQPKSAKNGSAKNNEARVCNPRRKCGHFQSGGQTIQKLFFNALCAILERVFITRHKLIGHSCLYEQL